MLCVCRQALTTELSSQHKTVQSQTAQLAGLDKQLSEAQQKQLQLESSLSGMSAELRVSRERVAQLEEANRKLSEEVEAGVQLSVEVVNLKQDLEAVHRQLDAQELAHRSRLNKFGLQVVTLKPEHHHRSLWQKSHLGNCSDACVKCICRRTSLAFRLCGNDARPVRLFRVKVGFQQMLPALRDMDEIR